MERQPTVLVYDGAATDVWRAFVEREASSVVDEVAPPDARLAYDRTPGRRLEHVLYGRVVAVEHTNWAPPDCEWVLVAVRGAGEPFVVAAPPAAKNETAQTVYLSVALMEGCRVVYASQWSQSMLVGDLKTEIKKTLARPLRRLAQRGGVDRPAPTPRGGTFEFL